MMKENYGINVRLDFNYYPRGQWDNQDAVINGWRIDIKGTRKGGRWMLIEWNKLVFRQRDNNLSHVYLMFLMDWNRQTDQPNGWVSYKGAVSLSRLIENTPTTAVLRKGTTLPGTKTYLQADNFGIQFKDLYKDLDHLVEYLTQSPPLSSLTDNFRNPYTGETTTAILSKTKVPENSTETAQAKQPQERKNGVMRTIVEWLRKKISELK